MAEEKTCDKMSQTNGCGQGECEATPEKPRVDTSNFTVEDQKLFLQGWKEAGGFMGDMHTESPFCAPWSRDEIVELDGDDPVKWGRDYWEAKKEELVNAALLEAFDHVQGTVASAFANSMVMTEVDTKDLFGGPHKVVTPAFDAKELPGPLAIFAAETVTLTPEQVTQTFGSESADVTLYVFTDGSGLLGAGNHYVALSEDETAQLQDASKA